jgi:hypothetical protein
VKSPKERLTGKRARADVRARRFLKSTLPGSDPERITIHGALKALRAAAAASLPPAVRKALLERLSKALANEFRTMKIQPKDFGLDGVEDIAEAYVRMLERAKATDYAPQRLRALAAGAYSRQPGLRSIFAGELFEQLVGNMRELQDDLKLLAGTQLAELNDALAAGKLLDGNGEPLEIKGSFDKIERVTDIVERFEKSTPKFIDAAYVALFWPAGGGQPMLAILAETEIKLPGAAKELSKQVAKALGRFSTTDGIEVMFAGATDPEPFARQNLIFGQTLMDRTGVTTTLRPKTTYRWRNANQAGFKQGYIRVGLAVDVDELYRLVNVLFRK